MFSLITRNRGTLSPWYTSSRNLMTLRSSFWLMRLHVE